MGRYAVRAFVLTRGAEPGGLCMWLPVCLSLRRGGGGEDTTEADASW